MAEFLATLTGAHGGTMAIAFATGCVATYGFCQRTMLSDAQMRIGELKGEIMTLRDQIVELDRELRNEIRIRADQTP